MLINHYLETKLICHHTSFTVNVHNYLSSKRKDFKEFNVNHDKLLITGQRIVFWAERKDLNPIPIAAELCPRCAA